MIIPNLWENKKCSKPPTKPYRKSPSIAIAWWYTQMAPADSACATASRATLLKFTKRGKESQALISPRAEWCSECSQISFVQKSSNKSFGVFNQQTSRFVVEIANLCVLVYKPSLLAVSNWGTTFYHPPNPMEHTPHSGIFQTKGYRLGI